MGWEPGGSWEGSRTGNHFCLLGFEALYMSHVPCNHFIFKEIPNTFSLMETLITPPRELQVCSQWALGLTRPDRAV